MLYFADFVNKYVQLFVEVAAICSSNNKEHMVESSKVPASSTLLISLLDTLHVTLKYVSDVVRRALQAKRGAAGKGDNKETELAELLLLTNKPFTKLMSLLTQLVSVGFAFLIFDSRPGILYRINV